MSDSEQKIFWLPKYEDIPVLEHSVMLKTALEVCALLREQLNEAAERLQIQEQLLQKQAEQIALHAEEIQRLKDEIAILKGEKPRPKIKPSTLNCDSDGGGGSEGSNKGNKGKRGKPSRKKTIASRT